MWVAKATRIFFCQNISIYGIFNDQNFNGTLTNDIVSFEQLGPDCYLTGILAFTALWANSADNKIIHRNRFTNDSL